MVKALQGGHLVAIIFLHAKNIMINMCNTHKVDHGFLAFFQMVIKMGVFRAQERSRKNPKKLFYYELNLKTSILYYNICNAPTFNRFFYQVMTLLLHPQITQRK